MKSIQSFQLLSLIASVATAAYPSGSFKYYANSGCSGASSFQITIGYPPEDVACASDFDSEDGFQTVSGDSQEYIAWIDAPNLPTSCVMATLSAPTNGYCGKALQRIPGGTANCVKTTLQKAGGFAVCCEGQQGGGCDVVPNPAGKLRRNAVLEAPSLNKTDRVARNVADVKKSPFLNGLQKRSCGGFTGSVVGQRNGAQQIVSDKLSCPTGKGQTACSITLMNSVTTGSTNSFGASESTSVTDDDLFVDIQESVSFSYMYSYSESKSVSQSYTVEVPAGESGYLTWTPTLSCASGSFPSSCGLPSSSGQACIPLYIGGGSTGSLLGDYSFLESL